MKCCGSEMLEIINIDKYKTFFFCKKCGGKMLKLKKKK